MSTTKAKAPAKRPRKAAAKHKQVPNQGPKSAKAVTTATPAKKVARAKAGSRGRRDMSHLPPEPRKSYAARSLGAADQLLEEMGRYPLLTRAQEQYLGRLIRTTTGAAQEEAISRLMLHNLRLVWYIAKRFTLHDVLDAFQDGVLGLRAAAKRFDPDADASFATHAERAMVQAISRAPNPVGLPLSLSGEAAPKLRRVLRYEQTTPGGSLHSDEIVAKATGMTASYVRTTRKVIGLKFSSLNVDTWTSPAKRGELPRKLGPEAASEQALPVDGVDEIEKLQDSLDDEPNAEKLKQALEAVLSPRQVAIVCMKNGIGRVGGVELSACEIAVQLNLSTNMIYQIYADALELLRQSDHAKELFRQWLDISGRATKPTRDPEPEDDVEP